MPQLFSQGNLRTWGKGTKTGTVLFLLQTDYQQLFSN